MRHYIYCQLFFTNQESQNFLQASPQHYLKIPGLLLIAHQVLLKWSNQGEWDWKEGEGGMWHVGRRREMNTWFWCEIRRKDTTWEMKAYRGGQNCNRSAENRLGGVDWTNTTRKRISTERLRKQHLTFGLHKLGESLDSRINIYFQGKLCSVFQCFTVHFSIQ